MANRIAGITIEIGGDTTKLNKALESTNKSIKSTQTQLKDVEKLLKLDPTNINLLKQKQELLTKAVDDTNTKLKTLKEAQKQMDANGVDKNSDQYKALQREIVATEQDLKGLEKAASQSNATLSQIGAVAQQISDKTGEWAEKTKALSMAAAGGLTALGGLAYKAVTTADDLNTLSQQTGFTTAELQKMEYAAGRMDVEVDTIVGAARKLKKSMTSTSDSVTGAFDALGVSVTDASGNVRNSNDVFWEVVEALGMVEDETQRDILAMDIFGKSADELAGLIDDGGAAFRGMGDEAERLNLILSQDTLDTLNETNDKLDQVKAQASATMLELGAKAAEVLLPLFEKVTAGISQVLEWLGSLDQGQLQTIMTILAVVAAISPLLSIISAVSGAIATVTTIISTISSLLPVISGAISGLFALLAANPIGIVVTAIAALVAAFVLLWNKSEGFRNFWIELWEKIKAVFSPVIDAVQAAFGKLSDKIKSDILPELQKLWQAIEKNVLPVLKSIADVIKSNLQPTFEWLKTGLGNLKIAFQTDWDVIKTMTSGTFENIKTVISTAWNVIKTVVSTALDVIKNVIKTATAVINGDWRGAWEGIKNIFSSIWNGIKSILSSVWSGIVSIFNNNLNTVKSVVSRIFEGIKSTIQNTINGAKNIVKSGLDAIKGFFSNLKIKFPSIKIPHFEISGKFSLDPPSMPKISVKWHAKAMQNAALLNSPTIFGMMGGKLLGGGEAGQEVVAGAATLMKMIEKAVKSTLFSDNSAVANSLSGTIHHTGTIRIEGVNNRGEFVAAGNAVINSMNIKDIADFVMDEMQAKTERRAAVY